MGYSRQTGQTDKAIYIHMYKVGDCQIKSEELSEELKEN